jgi:hypothetical protein
MRMISLECCAKRSVGSSDRGDQVANRVFVPEENWKLKLSLSDLGQLILAPDNLILAFS